MTRVSVDRALISVYDKGGIVDLALGLVASGVEIVSSGGTARVLREAGVEVVEVSEVTGTPEILGGRVKTLHPRVHGGILADLGRAEHRSDLETNQIGPFQLVVANLYPFAETVAAGATEAEAIEQIDIGGPAMIRAAAKNHRWVGVVTSPEQYEEVAQAVQRGGLDDDLRRRLAREAFFRTATYDAAIVEWLERHDDLPERIVLPLQRRRELRYGENPHQRGGLYAEVGRRPWWDDVRQVQGKELSFNNMTDAESAWRLAWEFELPAAVVVKHTIACGVAEAPTLAGAFAGAWSGDPVAAFGGVVALSRPLDAATAHEIADGFVEVVIAPDVLPDAAAILAGSKNLRLLEAPWPLGRDWDLRRVEWGLLFQARDEVRVERENWEVAGSVRPTAEQWDDLEFAWKVAAHAKSNAVVVAAGRVALGVGAGDQSRIGAARRAVALAAERAPGAVAASDAFFPFRDGLDVLAGAGVAAIIEPGGSRRDQEVIAAADEHGIALVMTGRRHFRH